MTCSKETELELKLRTLNSKLVMYGKLYKYVYFGFLRIRIANIVGSLNLERDNCFRELRSTIRKKYPEKFIRSDTNG